MCEGHTDLNDVSQSECDAIFGRACLALGQFDKLKVLLLFGKSRHGGMGQQSLQRAQPGERQTEGEKKREIERERAREREREN